MMNHDTQLVPQIPRRDQVMVLLRMQVIMTRKTMTGAVMEAIRPAR